MVSAPSGKTSYVVVGEEPGASKLEKAKKLNLKQINEDEFLDLIRSSSPVQLPTVVSEPVKPIKPVNKGKSKIVSMESSEMTTKTTQNTLNEQSKTKSENNELWTVKYKPKSSQEIIGNQGIVEKLSKWLKEWQKNSNAGFPKGEFSCFRAVLLSGPPGIGKTTMAHLVAELQGFEAIEFNASDTRSKKALDVFLLFYTL